MIVRRGIPRRSSRERCPLAGQQLASNGGRDRTCNVLLELEQICGGPVVFLTPDAKPVLSPDQANRDTNATGGTSQTSLHQVMHAKGAAKSDDITLGRTLRTPHRVAALHLQARQVAETRGNLLRETISQIGIGRVA